MPLIALALVLCAAVLHASWSIAARRAASRGHPGVPFVWLYSAIGNLFWAPVLAWILVESPPPLRLSTLLSLLATGTLHLAYGLVLQHAYKVSELSVVYPVARGLGPTLSTLGAVLLLHERPGPLAMLGAGLVVLGVFGLAGGRARGERVLSGVAWGALTGALIASYTLVDGNAVRNLAIPALLVDYAGNLVRMCSLAPAVLRDRVGLRAVVRGAWREAAAVAVLGTGGYVMVLTAMKLAPLSHVAPAREVSMLIATWVGAKAMQEGELPRRLLASGLMVAGVVLLAVG